MLSPWLNTTVKVQRRSAASRNVLGEPDYGSESAYPSIYTSLDVRIEFWDEQMQFTEIGERVVPTKLQMYVEPDSTIQAEDRITILTLDAATIIGQLYIVTFGLPRVGCHGEHPSLYLRADRALKPMAVTLHLQITGLRETLSNVQGKQVSAKQVQGLALQRVAILLRDSMVKFAGAGHPANPEVQTGRLQKLHSLYPNQSH